MTSTYLEQARENGQREFLAAFASVRAPVEIFMLEASPETNF